jgi:hypothetical protein
MHFPSIDSAVAIPFHALGAHRLHDGSSLPRLRALDGFAGARFRLWDHAASPRTDFATLSQPELIHAPIEARTRNRQELGGSQFVAACRANGGADECDLSHFKL